MLEYLIRWPLETSETLALLAFIGAILGGFMRILRKLDTLLSDIADVAKKGEERGVAQHGQIEAVEARVTALESQSVIRAQAESSISATLVAIQTQVSNLSTQINSLITALLQGRPN